jgi:hypothetical protein
MKTCRRSREHLATGFEGLASPETRDEWKEHLAMCPDCRKQWEEAEAILRGAAALKDDVRKAMEAVDWDALPEQIADRAFARPDIGPVRKRFRPALPAFGWKPVFAGVLGGLLIGASVMYFVLRAPAPGRRAAGRISAPLEFIDRAELSLAKRETIDYLDKSQALLLDFVQADPEEAGRMLAGESAVRRTADLLSTKRLVDAQLDEASMAKARSICDQIERLFVELSRISEEMSAEEAARIQRYIEEKNLLLRIKLLRGELAGSEV